MIEITDGGKAYLMPDRVSIDWICKDLSLSDRTLIKYRVVLLEKCPAYHVTASARYCGGFAQYQADAILRYPLPLYLDNPPFSRDEALIIRAFAWLVWTKGRGKGRLERAIAHLDKNPDFWRNFTAEDYLDYRRSIENDSQRDHGKNRVVLGSDRLPVTQRIVAGYEFRSGAGNRIAS